MCVSVCVRKAAFGHNDLTTDNAFYWQEDGSTRLSVGLPLGCGGAAACRICQQIFLALSGASGFLLHASQLVKPSAGSFEVRLAAKLYEQHWSRVGLELALLGA